MISISIKEEKKKHTYQNLLKIKYYLLCFNIYICNKYNMLQTEKSSKSSINLSQNSNFKQDFHETDNVFINITFYFCFGCNKLKYN